MSAFSDDPWRPRPEVPARSAAGAPAPVRGVRTPLFGALSLGVSTALLVFAILALARAWWIRQSAGPEPTSIVPVALASEVDLWVGEVAPGVTGVLSAEWDDPGVDARYDEQMNRALHVPADDPLAYYRLRLFNTGSEAVTVRLAEGSIVVTPRGGPALPMRSLASLLAAAGVSGAEPAQVATLRALGAAREEVEVPAGRVASHPVAFGRRVALGHVESVARADGTAFHLRRIPRRRWTGLVESPHVEDLRDL